MFPFDKTKRKESVCNNKISVFVADAEVRGYGHEGGKIAVGPNIGRKVYSPFGPLNPDEE
jgi:hypothetical protein